MLTLSLQQWLAFLLVLMRNGAMVATMPFFGSPNVPTLAKAGLALAMTVLLQPVANLDPRLLPQNPWALALLGAGELMIGAILGLAVRLLFTAVQIMGQLVGFQMGFAVANVIDPMGEGQVSVLGQFAYMMAILVFLAVNGHHWFFSALVDSFKLVPPGALALKTGLYRQMMNLAAQMFSLAVRLGAPVIGALLFTSAVMGILAKTVPQMNILIVGFPLKIAVGLFFLAFSLSVMLPMLARVFRGLGPVLGGLLRAM